MRPHPDTDREYNGDAHCFLRKLDAHPNVVEAETLRQIDVARMS